MWRTQPSSSDSREELERGLYRVCQRRDRGAVDQVHDLRTLSALDLTILAAALVMPVTYFRGTKLRPDASRDAMTGSALILGIVALITGLPQLSPPHLVLGSLIALGSMASLHRTTVVALVVTGACLAVVVTVAVIALILANPC